MGAMNKRELAKAVAVQADVELKTVVAVLDGFTDVVTAVVAKGVEAVSIPGFAKFVKVDRPARMGRNPATGEAIRIKASKKARITPVKAFKDAVLAPAKAPKLAKGAYPTVDTAVAAAGKSAAPAAAKAPAKKATAARRAPAKKATAAAPGPGQEGDDAPRPGQEGHNGPAGDQEVTPPVPPAGRREHTTSDRMGEPGDPDPGREAPELQARARRPLSEPHPDRLPADHPHRAQILRAHDDALHAGADTYLDPASGLAVLTAGYLTRRGACCESGCRHCPYLA